MSNLAFLDKLALADVVEFRDIAPIDASIIAPDQAKSATVAGGSVVAFTEGLSAQQKNDVLDTLQLAQRAADHDVSRFQQPRKWFEKLIEVLSNSCWIINHSDFTEHDLKEGEYQVAKSAVKILAAIATGPQTAVLTAALTALEGLADGDGQITIFEHYGARGAIGSFLITTATVGTNGTVDLAFASYELRMDERKRKFLFFKWRENQVKFWASIQKATFDPACFDNTRNKVRQLLGEKRLDYLSEIKL